MTSFARTEREGFCSAALAAGPDAPTLCEGWTVLDLVVHVYQRESDPISGLAMLVPALSDLADRRKTELLATNGFTGVVELVRQGPPKLSPFSIPGVDELANGFEFFVHHEDIRRGVTVPPSRVLPHAVEDLIWKRLRLLGRLMFRNATEGVVLERSDSVADPEEPGESLRVAPGNPTVTLVGLPSELLLYAFGRTSAAHVRIVGDDQSVRRFEGLDLRA